MSENDISTAWALTWMLDVGPYGCSSALQRMKSVANRHCSKQEVKGRKATYRSRVFHTRESRTTTGKPRHRRLRDKGLHSEERCRGSGLAEKLQLVGKLRRCCPVHEDMQRV